MNAFPCDREIEVIRAIQASRWADSPGLRAHAAECETCAEVALVAHALANAEDEVHPLPDASLVWWKAQLRARREAVERASEPIEIFERVAYAFAGIALVAALIWQRARLGHLLGLASRQTASGTGWLGWVSWASFSDRLHAFFSSASLFPWAPEWTIFLAAAASLAAVVGITRLALSD